jgi:hypothetical protein
MENPCMWDKIYGRNNYSDYVKPETGTQKLKLSVGKHCNEASSHWELK